MKLISQERLHDVHISVNLPQAAQPDASGQFCRVKDMTLKVDTKWLKTYLVNKNTLETIQDSGMHSSAWKNHLKELILVELLLTMENSTRLWKLSIELKEYCSKICAWIAYITIVSHLIIELFGMVETQDGKQSQIWPFFGKFCSCYPTC